MLARLADLLEEQAPAIYKKWIAKARAKEYTNGTIIHAAVWPTLLAALRIEDPGSFRRRLHDVIPNQDVAQGAVPLSQRDNLAVQSALAGQTVVTTRLHDVFRPPGTTADLRRVAKTCRYPRHCLDPPYGPRAPDGRTAGWLFQGRNLTARVDVSSGLRPAGRHSHRKSAVPSRDRAPVDKGSAFSFSLPLSEALLEMESAIDQAFDTSS